MAATIARAIGHLAFLAGVACAQSFTAIDGRVVDREGGAISGAFVELTNIDTGMTRSVTTAGVGLFSFGQLPPGKYSLTAQAPGFSAKTLQDLQLLVNTAATVTIELSVGPLNEKIAVSADSARVNTVDASLGNAVDSRMITELPFEARNPA